MKLFLIRQRYLFIILFVFKYTLFYGQIDSISTSKLIDSIKIEDQKWRNLATKVYKKEVDTITIDSIKNKIKEVDSLNYLLIKDLFNKYGYLGYDKVGKQSSHNFWLLVQHADRHPAFQDSVLAAMQIEAEKGNASYQDYAYLLDRVKVNAGQLQVYGTQMQVNSSGTSYEPKPVIEPDKLNERRTKAGLSTIEKYIEIMNENYLHKK